jgi:hypothetical protein
MKKQIKISKISKLLAVEEDRAAGRAGVTPDELESYSDTVIGEVEHDAV